MSELIEQIKKHEGLELKPYKCTTGHLTIGYGRNLESNGISQEEAEYLLNNDLQDLSLRLSCWGFWGELNDARKSVLVNMAFNIGVSGLLKFKKTLAAIDDCFYEKAAKEMLDSKWANQVGNRAIGLSEQMRTGEWQ